MNEELRNENAVDAKATTKKGNRSWQAPLGETLKKEKGWGYRWTAEANIPERLQEGWELVVAEKGDGQVTFVDGKDKVFGGTRLDTVVAKRDRVMMRMKTEMIEERNSFYNKRSDGQVEAIVGRMDEETGGAGHGKLEIQKGRVKTIIE